MAITWFKLENWQSCRNAEFILQITEMFRALRSLNISRSYLFLLLNWFRNEIFRMIIIVHMGNAF